jgi:hypothetical protein
MSSLSVFYDSFCPDQLHGRPPAIVETQFREIPVQDFRGGPEAVAGIVGAAVLSRIEVEDAGVQHHLKFLQRMGHLMVLPALGWLWTIPRQRSLNAASIWSNTVLATRVKRCDR